MKAKFDITGMNCAACSSSIERTVNALGVQNVNVNLISGVMNVEFDDSTISKTVIVDAVKKLGFGIEDAKTVYQKRQINLERTLKNQKDLLKRFIVSLCFLIPLMYISMGSMYSLPMPSVLEENLLVFSLCQLILTLPILFINKAYYISGFKHLFSKSPNMDSLVAIGTISPVIYGIFAIYKIYQGDIHFAHDLYFETAGMILTLVTLGKYLEGKSKSGTGKALDMLIDLTPKFANVIIDGKEQKIDSNDLLEGQTVIIRPGESFVCDGIILSGQTYVDESSLTGESLPVFKDVGSNVSAGTINKNGSVTVLAKSVGQDTVISKIVGLVEDASGSKAPISRLADKTSAVFVPIVLAISVITDIIWVLCGYDFEFAFSRAICVLVISCPCALGLATPLAITVGTGIGAQNGILIKNAQTLELMGKIDTVLFDKTGTLTNGKPVVTDTFIFENISEKDFWSVALTIENPSEHPLSTAIKEKAKEFSTSEISTPDFFDSVAGKGIRAGIVKDVYLSGNPAFLNENNIFLSQEQNNIYEKLCCDGKTPLIFSKNQTVIGIVAVSDTPKADSKKAIQKLKDVGIKSIMLTGDNQTTALAIANTLGIDDVCAGVLPQQKHDKVKSFKNKNGIIAMVGDGINDAPALAQADIGFSVSNGTDIAIESADVILMNNDVYSVPKAISLSKKTISNIKLSLFWALFYNALGIPVAAGALYPLFSITLNPMIGALAMSLSSICVVLNALRLKKFKFE